LLICAAEFDKLLRFITRHQTAMSASPIPPAGHIPPAFLQILVELEQGVTDTISAEKSASKKMAPVKAKALNGLRQTIKKKAKEFEVILKTYNEVSNVFLMSTSDRRRAETV
jgi:translation initiation factor 3 subunit C